MTTESHPHCIAVKSTWHQEVWDIIFALNKHDWILCRWNSPPLWLQNCSSIWYLYSFMINMTGLHYIFWIELVWWYMSHSSMCAHAYKSETLHVLILICIIDCTIVIATESYDKSQLTKLWCTLVYFTIG